MTKPLQIVARALPDGCDFTVKGRNAWALLELLNAGSKGVTPLDNPGPRWSSYIWNLKREFHLDIETLHESHRGDFPGRHARYVLQSQVEIVSRSFQQERTEI